MLLELKYYNDLNASHEIVNMPDSMFPVKVFIRSYTKENYIFVHPHWHEEVEILYFIKGNARQQVDGDIFEVNAGHMTIIPSESVHSTYTDRNESNEIIVIQFGAAFFKNLRQGIEETNLIEKFFKLYNIRNPISSEIPAGKELEACILCIWDELDKKEEGFELYLKSYVLKLTGIILRYMGGSVLVKKKAYAAKKYRDMLRDTFSYIDSNFSHTITLNNAANSSNFSVPHFSRLFKNLTGMTFAEYLSYYRVLKAEKLLETLQNALDIAYECGFGSHHAFIRAFRKYKGLTPSEYRKRYI